ncbi:MAG TPA: preprotein translocase subunit SecG [Steroidobacteraceae bacterium]|nr:preprotein translocase subunit SecG [Steroidobacteraceae bacterium]
MGQQVILIIHVFLAIGIIGLVLLQRGKGADAGAGFGAGASGTVFGARGSASAFSRATAILATLFFITSLTLAYLAGHKGRSVPQDEALLPQSTPAETVPAPQSAPLDAPPATQDQTPAPPATPMQ